MKTDKPFGYKRRWRNAIALAAVGAIALAPAAEAKTVTVQTSGRAVKLKVGDKLVVNVAENPSTGYAWKAVKKPALLKLQSSKYTPPQYLPTGGYVGASGTRVFTYKALKTGSGRLTLTYQRSSAPSAGATRFVVDLVVKH